MEEKTIQSIPVMPFALMLACIGAAIGLIIGIIYALTFGALLAFITSSTAIPSSVNLGWFSLFLGVGAIITMPILGFIGGLINGVISSVAYNYLAPRIGGIKLRFKEEYRQPQP